MPKRKLQRFAEIETFKNVFQHIQYEESVPDFHLKDKWNELYFKNTNPIVLELGCGKGEYTIGLAEKYPDKIFIGVDLKGNRIWKGAKAALEKNMTNVAFVRTGVDIINSVFDKNEVDEIWITFPDPQPQKPRERKRLTSPRFLERYKNILAPAGCIHLKTDNFPFYEYTLEIIKENSYPVIDYTHDLYGDTGTARPEATSIMTYYEKKFTDKGIKICYLKFKLNA